MKRCAREACSWFAPTWFIEYARPTTAELGRCGETLAARYLARLGWKILGRRVRTPHAELDLVALDRGVLVAIEVKTGRIRAGARHAPREHLGARTLRRQQRAVHALARAGVGRSGPVTSQHPDCRVDLVELSIHEDGSVRVTHLSSLKAKTWPGEAVS